MNKSRKSQNSICHVTGWHLQTFFFNLFVFSYPSYRYAVIAFGCASCPKITCGREGCGTEFCYHCKQLWHPNQTCDAARQQRAQSLRLRTVRSSSLSYSQESGAAGQLSEHTHTLLHAALFAFSSCALRYQGWLHIIWIACAVNYTDLKPNRSDHNTFVSMVQEEDCDS